jgi:hypothetical protein
LGGCRPQLLFRGFTAGCLVHTLLFRPSSAKVATDSTSGSSPEAPHRLG